MPGKVQSFVSVFYFYFSPIFFIRVGSVMWVCGWAGGRVVRIKIQSAAASHSGHVVSLFLFIHFFFLSLFSSSTCYLLALFLKRRTSLARARVRALSISGLSLSLSRALFLSLKKRAGSLLDLSQQV